MHQFFKEIDALSIKYPVATIVLLMIVTAVFS